MPRFDYQDITESYKKELERNILSWPTKLLNIIKQSEFLLSQLSTDISKSNLTPEQQDLLKKLTLPSPDEKTQYYLDRGKNNFKKRFRGV